LTHRPLTLALPQELVSAIAERAAELVVAQLERDGSSWPRWLTVEQAAHYLGTTPKAIRGRIDRGRIPVTRDGRRVYIDRVELDAAMEQRGG
jgi:excisionase family DNA binding protein